MYEHGGHLYNKIAELEKRMLAGEIRLADLMHQWKQIGAERLSRAQIIAATGYRESDPTFGTRKQKTK